MAKRKKIKDGIVMHGEATGHAHRLVEGAVLWEDAGQRIVEGKGGRMVHEEHKPVVLDETEYVVKRIREYDHMEEEARYVVD